MTGELVVPDSVTGEIGEGTFYGCKFTSIKIGNGITAIGQEAFYNNKASESTSLVLGNNITTIKQSAFSGASIGGNLVIPDSVTEIQKWAFYNCQNLTGDLSLSKNLKSLGEQAFFNCKFTGPIIIPDGITSIPISTFHGADTVCFVVPGSVTEFGNYSLDDRRGDRIIYLDNNTQEETLKSVDLGNKSSPHAITNGGSFAADTQFTAGTLATPTKNGAIFEGWYDNAEFTGEAVKTAEAGKTYYAKWIGMENIELQYGAEQTIVSNGVTLSGYESDNPSVATVDTNGNVKAVGVGTATISATGTYDNQPTNFTMTVTVTPRPINYTLTGDDTGSGSITYNYSDEHHALSDYMTFKWADKPETVVRLTEGADINYTYTVVDPEAPDEGKSFTYDYLPMPVGEYTVSFNLKNPNYTFKLSDGNTGNTLAVKVNVTEAEAQRAYLASAAPTANQNFSYTGEGVLPVEGILNAYAENSVSSSTVEIGTFTVNIEGLNGTSFHSEVSEIEAGTNLSAISGLALPTDPGTYIITASAANDNYYLYKSLVFTINKATVTVTAADKTVIAGDKDGLPSLNNPTEGKDYTVTGLAAGHSLTTAPTLNYADGANVDAVATYSIIPFGATANEKYYTIQYVNGTLHVEKIAIIEGANQTWTKESGKDLVIRSNADFSDFLGVTVNDVELVQDQDYTAKSGSTIVTIKADYLNSLAAGDYKIAIVSDTGSAVTKFTVKAEAAGDSDTSNNDNTAGGNTGSTTTQSGSGIVYYTCPACGYHDWTAGADGYKCNHCGYVESVKQLSGYGNVKGVYEPKTSAAAAQSASATSSSAIPQTGDESQPLVWVTLVVVSGAALAGLAVYRKKRSDK